MDSRTQRRLRREAVRNVGYTKFLKKHTHNKNITAREERMLKRRDLREKCLKKEAEKKARKDVKMTFKEESRKQALTLKSVVDGCYSRPSIKACFERSLPTLKEINDELRKKDLVVMPMWEMEHSSDINKSLKKTLREIFERTTRMQSAHFNNDNAEFNYHCYKIRELCNKHLHIVTGALCERK
tara:strand:+ start:77 stop:628 length:552 start_codon:yes stop_codon:yes gene_type:complete